MTSRLPAGCTTADIDALEVTPDDRTEHWCRWCWRKTFGFVEDGNGWASDQFVCAECGRGTDVGDRGDDEAIARRPLSIVCPADCTCHGRATS